MSTTSLERECTIVISYGLFYDVGSLEVLLWRDAEAMRIAAKHCGTLRNSMAACHVRGMEFVFHSVKAHDAALTDFLQARFEIRHHLPSVTTAVDRPHTLPQSLLAFVLLVVAGMVAAALWQFWTTP